MSTNTITALFLSAIVIGIALATPYCLRLLAAILLTHADTLEAAREERRRQWDRHSRHLGVVQQEVVTSGD